MEQKKIYFIKHVCSVELIGKHILFATDTGKSACDGSSSQFNKGSWGLRLATSNKVTFQVSIQSKSQPLIYIRKSAKKITEIMITIDTSKLYCDWSPTPRPEEWFLGLHKNWFSKKRRPFYFWGFNVWTVLEI